MLPSSQTSEEENEVPLAAGPVPPIGIQPSGRRRGDFVYPQRRMRGKTSPAPSQDSKEVLHPELEQLAQAAEDAVALEHFDEEDQEMNFDANEDAAASMGFMSCHF
eukprot:s526_g40.t1